MNAPPLQIARVKLAVRAALGLIWIYEGLIPKFLFLHADQLALVKRSGLVWRSPQWTLHWLGAAQIAMGLWLLAGRAERCAVIIASGWMCLLILLVARGNPDLLIDPYGALIKDLALLACAFTVWRLSDPQAASEHR
ncbi:MAG: DoxX-like family protein [Chthoniobacterales bacterium]